MENKTLKIVLTAAISVSFNRQYRVVLATERRTRDKYL